MTYVDDQAPILRILDPTLKYGRRTLIEILDEVVLIDFEKRKIQRPELIHKLRENNIGTMVHYIPLHLQPIFKGKNKLEGAEKYYNQCLSLPLHTNMRASDVKHVFMKLKELIMN